MLLGGDRPGDPWNPFALGQGGVSEKRSTRSKRIKSLGWGRVPSVPPCVVTRRCRGAAHMAVPCSMPRDTHQRPAHHTLSPIGPHSPPQ